MVLGRGRGAKAGMPGDLRGRAEDLTIVSRWWAAHLRTANLSASAFHSAKGLSALEWAGDQEIEVSSQVLLGRERRG